MMMMMIGNEGNQQQTHPTVHVPPWSLFDDSMSGGGGGGGGGMSTAMGFPLPVSGVNVNVNGGGGGCSGGVGSPGGGGADYIGEALAALQHYLPSNDIDSDDTDCCRESDIPVDAYSCDEFRMYEFKVRRCARGRSHDWTECPYAHPGEKARRRDPRKFHYSGTACPDFRKGNCKRGDTCEYAHGVFECWLHPARYRTQPCKDGTSCRRRVCFFAHTPEQLRVLPQQSPRSAESPPSYDGSPLRVALDSYFGNGASMLSSPTSTLISPPISPSSDSPPLSPSLNRPMGSNSVNEMVSSLRNLQLNKVKSAPSSWGGVQIGSGFCSPRGTSSSTSILRPGFSSLPTTPTTRATPTRSGIGYLENFWDRCSSLEEEPALERVESGRNLRSKIYEKLSKENSLERVERVDSAGQAPDVGWVSELLM